MADAEQRRHRSRYWAGLRGPRTGAGLIVLAARGEGGVARLLGAVSQYVLRHAPCPVLVVPNASKDL